MKNMGSMDRSLRIVVAVLLAVLYYLNVISGVLGIVLIALAVIFILTSLVSTCPLYMPFKFSTRSKS